jgi:hypothetical protein
LGAIVNVAVSDVVLVTLTLLTVIPDPLTDIWVPPFVVKKFVPVSVTVGALPLSPLEGEIPLMVGAGVGGATENVSALLVPFALVTVRGWVPAGVPAATVNVTVIVLSLTTLTSLAVTPAPLMETVVGPVLHPALAPPTANPDPEIVTELVVPITPVLGESDVKLGGVTTPPSCTARMTFAPKSAI